MIWSNWAGNVQARPRGSSWPADEADLARLVADATNRRRRVKVVGAGHSCSDIASSEGAELVRLDRMSRVVSVDRAARSVVAEAGISLAALAEELAAHGLALGTLPAIAAPTIAGAIATGTHGTGVSGLAEMVTSMRVVTASGARIDVDPSQLDAFRTSLGALGIMTEVGLRCEDAYDLELSEEPASFVEALDALERRADERFGFYWFPHVDLASLRTFRRVPPRPRAPRASWWGDVVVGNRLHELLRFASRNAAAVNAAWFRAAFGSKRVTADRSDRVLTSTILVRQRVLEYAVPLARAREALEAVRALIAEGHEAQAPIDVRIGGPERAWLGLAHGRATCWIGLIAFRPFGRETAWERFFRAADAVLRRFDGRPHWGKIHWQDAASLRPLYPRWDDFTALRAELDPHGTFLNDHLRAVLGIA